MPARRLVKADKASIESARAQIVSQEAAVNNAKVALSYTIIRSPLDGRTGNLAVKTGNLVTANTTELMTIAQIQPVYVTFAVPAVHLATIKHHMADGTTDGHRHAAGHRRQSRRSAVSRSSTTASMPPPTPSS